MVGVTALMKSGAAETAQREMSVEDYLQQECDKCVRMVKEFAERRAEQLVRDAEEMKQVLLALLEAEELEDDRAPPQVAESHRPLQQ
ncbi:hypothetical protein FVE85_8621 [Porphyridium purpureum]|uniref:Uncharacterized protein n=1 Tax=Porphyridium purpureum TaxID=35688 RepID=A0A5J4YPC3_PORPP|nr:hypothetical protein FVE85_8621 [Porphyridium purpureum]|eukprot:POR1214..scf296_7